MTTVIKIEMIIRPGPGRRERPEQRRQRGSLQRLWQGLKNSVRGRRGSGELEIRPP